MTSIGDTTSEQINLPVWIHFQSSTRLDAADCPFNLRPPTNEQRNKIEDRLSREAFCHKNRDDVCFLKNLTLRGLF
jgi:hypothetical protein